MNAWFQVGSVAAFLGVALGAFGAHGLRSRLSPDMLQVFEVAVRYQMYHALALLILGLSEGRIPPGTVRLAGTAFTLGILVFSGSLYVLSLSGIRWLGAITPIGGLLFLVGWFLLVLAAFRRA